MKKPRMKKRRARCTRLRKQVTRLQHSSVQYEVLAGIYERALDETEAALRRTNWKLDDSQKLAHALAERNTELSAELRKTERLALHNLVLATVTFGALALSVALNLFY